MQVQAIYNQGRIEFVEPLRLKHDHIRLVVTVPDEEIAMSHDQDQSPEQVQAASSFTARVDQILAPYQHILKASESAAPMDYKAIWHEHLADKYLGSNEKSDI